MLLRGLIDHGLFVGELDGLIERGAHALFFPHGIGHLLGLDVHDMEDFGIAPVMRRVERARASLVCAICGWIATWHRATR